MRARIGSLAGWGTLLAWLPAVWAQEETPELPRVVITGSAIKRVETEGPVPVQIITRAEIAATGATTTNELLHSIASIDIFEQGEQTTNSPAGSGTAFLRLRGLDETEVLVLLDGRRVAINALHDVSGLGGAVDLNMIPLSAIERVEILKDGGSAIYGADAVAGVVNFITRKDYRGAEAAATFGTSSRHDGTEKRINAAGGFGDLVADGYHFMATFEHFRRDPILAKDREISRTSDFRRYGGDDYRSLFAPQGNLLDGDFNISGATIRPCPPGLYSGACRYDINADLLAAYNGADRSSALVLGGLRLGSGLTGHLQVMHSESRDRFESHPVPGFFMLPTGEIYVGRFMQGGPRIRDRRSTLDGVSLGLEGRRRGIDWDIAAGYSRSHISNQDRNYYDADLWDAAVASGVLDATRDDIDPALVNSLKVAPRREGISALAFLDGKISGDFGRLPHGPLTYALGLSLWRESLVDTPDQLLQEGRVIGSIQQSAVDAARDAHALFAELNLPLTGNLEAQLAARHDHYDNASRTSPKAALKWRPTRQFMMRGSYAESFKMPRLRQLYGNQDQGAVTLNLPEECAALGLPTDCLVPAYLVTTSNRALRPERGRSWNLGGAVDLGPFSATLDWWQTRIADAIAVPGSTYALLSGRYSVSGNGELSLFTGPENLATREVSGIDLDARLRLPGVLGGTLTLRNATTHYLDMRFKYRGDPEWQHQLGTYSYPRLRNVLSLSYATPAWLISATHRFVGSFLDTDLTATGSQPLPADTRRVRSFSEVDVAASYRGWRQLTLTGGIKNLFDQEPPLSLFNAASANYSQLGFAELYSNRGRFIYLTAEYRFQ